jgi:hypothetical protein
VDFHEDLLQVVITNFSIIYNISDVENIVEVRSLQTLNQFMSSDSFVNTGFTLFTSHNDYNSSIEQRLRVDRTISANRTSEIFFKKEVITDEDVEYEELLKGGDASKAKEYRLNGYLSMTYSVTDLHGIMDMIQSFQRNKKVNAVDMQSVVGTFSGHTVFSLLEDKEKIIESII